MDDGLVKHRLMGVAKGLAEELRKEAVERLAAQSPDKDHENAVSTTVTENEHGVQITLVGNGDYFVELELTGEKAQAVLAPTIAACTPLVMKVFGELFQ